MLKSSPSVRIRQSRILTRWPGNEVSWCLGVFAFLTKHPTDTITVDKVHIELDREEQEELRREQVTVGADTTSLALEGKGVAGLLAFIRLGLHIQNTQYALRLAPGAQHVNVLTHRTM